MSLHTDKEVSWIEMDSLTLILDPSIPPNTDLQSYIPQEPPKATQCIILSHPNTYSITGYFLLLMHYPHLIDIPTYSTLPVARLAKCTTMETLRSVGLLGNVENHKYTIQDIDSIFNKIITVNYNQTSYVSLMELTPLNSGHSLGGANWVIKYNNYKLIYAPKWNHSKDSFLNGFNVENNSKILRPTTFITNELFPKTQFSYTRQKAKFIELLNIGLMNGSSFVLPTTLTERFFDLLFLITSTPSLDHIPIYLFNFTGIQTLEIADNFIQWMSKSITQMWESKNQSNRSIIDKNRIRIINKFNEISNEIDFNRTGIYFFEQSDSNLFKILISQLNTKLNFSMLLTDEINYNNELNELFEKWKSQTADVQGKLTILDEKVKWTFFSEVKLRQKELSNYIKSVEDSKKERELKQLKKQKEELEEEEDEEDDSKQKAIDGDTKDALEEENDNNNIDNDDDDDSDDEQPQSLTIEEIMKLPMDYDVSKLPLNEQRFPPNKNKRKIDDYGEIVNHKDYIQEEAVKEIIADTSNKKPKKEIKVILDSLFDSLTDPVKLVPTTKKITVRMGFTYLDLSGLHDQRAFEYVEKKLKPYQTILLNPNDETNSGETPLTNVITEYVVDLQQDDIKLQKVGQNDEYQIGFINGTIEEDPEDHHLILKSTEASTNYQIHIGDIKITSLYRTFKNNGYKVELLGDGRLVVENNIIVRKSTDGEILIESIDLTQTKTVKKAIMNQLAHISL